MAVIQSKSKWNLVTQESNMQKGKLIKVEIGPGRSQKMYEKDAIAQGLISGSKIKNPQSNKIKNPEQNKSASPSANSEVDDLASIPGVGKATVRALTDHGIVTFDQLANAEDLSFLPAKVIEAIEGWEHPDGESGNS